MNACAPHRVQISVVIAVQHKSVSVFHLIQLYLAHRTNKIDQTSRTMYFEDSEISPNE